ncbi:hypothetical protein HNO92_004327 [Chromobacterium alkanivorans]|uniref:hypothetical protein n=1 Tax=Chromobacterium alkanivorans TaxID=1071719 RepID=UPI0021685033|nr:hypothetical protein [Chromobacterium alkanivorans]MCS3806718.1 hypothetical protein [Chromobacterium alkanivorans]MCS3821110.1 hypothetical protein [Chromobacterium alkanivorans]MCS3875978.1 hypothetical protein [Chromobacterium alkanivorans]
MTEKAKISFYKIKECGFYRRGESTPAFGSIDALLSDLQRWSSNKNLVQTKVFEPRDGQDIHPAYLLDIKNSGDSWVVTTWNQTPANEAGVASIKGESNVGSAEVVINEIDPGSIPGFATYFWFLPRQNIFASVRFQHLWTGQKSLQNYFDSFLGSFSRYVVFDNTSSGADVEIIGYRDDEDDPPMNLLPRFKTALEQKPGRKDYIRQRAQRIRKVIRKSVLKLQRTPDFALWQTFLHKMHISPPSTRNENVKVQYEIATTVQVSDVDAIIAEWEEHHEREWDDYGFEFKGEANKTYWLSHSLARGEFDLDVVRDHPEVVNSESLLSALHAKREHILSILR